MRRTNLSEQVPDMLSVAFYVCKRSRFPVDDMEYDSAIHWAVAEACRVYTPTRDANPCTLAAIFAVRECVRVKEQHVSWRKQDEAGADRRRGYGPPTPTPIPITDFELLSFVAAHGRCRAAKLLMMNLGKLRELLDEVALRMRVAARE